MKTALLAALLTAAAIPARAEIAIAGLSWQTSSGKGAFGAAERWDPAAGAKGGSRVRAVATLENRGAVSEGLCVLRYAVSVRFARAKETGEGAWAVPFLSEETHVPLPIKPGQKKDVPVAVNRVALEGYLRRFQRLGFRADALRIQVMVEPRAGEALKDRVVESTLPVGPK
ncbi:MAG TPA: hypothetical protein VNI01_14400 [Elusimicrobiota bacterium]|nr:hypothetical protein [Elusimicrobiota bacterium]